MNFIILKNEEEKIYINISAIKEFKVSGTKIYVIFTGDRFYDKEYVVTGWEII